MTAAIPVMSVRATGDTSGGEENSCRPGYGLYDRALGIMYLWGCWDMLERLEGKAEEKALST